MTGFYHTDTILNTRETPNHSRCALVHAREAASDALALLAVTRVSRDGNVRERPEYWVGHLQYLLGHLVVVLEEDHDYS